MKIAKILLTVLLATTCVTIETHAAEQKPRTMTAENPKPKTEKKNACRTVEKKSKDRHGRMVVTRSKVCR